MKELDEHIFWKYLDGTLSEAEKNSLEQRRKDDPAFHAAISEREELHRQLQETTAEQPSLRFARRVMENLPAIYRRTLEPLVRPLWIKVFFGSLGTFLLSYFVLVAYYVQEKPIDQQDQVVSFANRIGGLIAGLPPQFFTVLAALSVGFLALILFDRFLKARLLKSGRPQNPSL